MYKHMGKDVIKILQGSAVTLTMLGGLTSVVVKDLRLKDKDKDLAGINTQISCRHRARSDVISCILSLSCHR